MSYALTIDQENKEIAKRYKDLLKGAYQSFSTKDIEKIRSAFNIALEAHSHQRRKTGEPYIFHPIAVAKIVAYEIGLGTDSIVAALLHDVVEDTDYTIEDIERLFGEVVARLVSGLTKISHLKKEHNVSVQAENFRKMILTLNDDVRTILIKIADRLHNMQTMNAMPYHKQLKISSETLFIYAPLAHRFGLYNIKSELEDLGLKYTEPEIYNTILKKIEENKDAQDKYIDHFSDVIKKHLDAQEFSYEIKGRKKSIFSIRKKMQIQNVSYEEIYDHFAIRIIYKSTRKEEKFYAWKIYSIVTDYFQPNPKRLRDWITQPKSTGYESLHTTVMGPQGKWVEVQIRSERMDEIAEKGYAAHYRYKNNDETDTGLDEWLVKIRESIENPNSNAIDFVEDFKLNLYAKEIFVFTPDGDLKALPQDSTALDFAFHVHTQIGVNCRGVKINGKIKPISQKLQNGDQVEVITSKNQKPSIGWLDFVVTARARNKIKNILKEEEKQIAKEGKELLKRKLRHIKINFNDKLVNEMVVYFNLRTSLDLFYRIGNGFIDNKALKEFTTQRNNAIVNFFKNTIKRKPTNNISEEEVSDNYDMLVFGKNEETLKYSISNCCSPIAGDKVFGFLTVSEGVKLHKRDCPNAIALQSNYAYRILKAKWIDSTKQSFKTILKIQGADHIGIVNEITSIISTEMNINIHTINISEEDGFFQGSLIVGVKNKNELQKLKNRIKEIDGIVSVDRIINS